MIDISRDMGIVIDIPQIADQLGINVVEINARKRIGIKELKDAISSVNLPKKEILNIKSSNNTLNLSTLKDGMYHIINETENKKVKRKIIIQK